MKLTTTTAVVIIIAFLLIGAFVFQRQITIQSENDRKERVDMCLAEARVKYDKNWSEACTEDGKEDVGCSLDEGDFLTNLYYTDKELCIKRN